jgi:hypothetical protein
MLDDMFSFIEPIIGLSEDATAFVIQAEAFFEFLEKTGLDKAVRSPEETAIKVPLDIALSLLTPDELEKLQNYIAFYLEKYDSG